MSNADHQRTGPPLPDWRVPVIPPREQLVGNFCRVEPLEPHRHAEELFHAFQADEHGRDWTYLPFGPFRSIEDFRAWAEDYTRRTDLSYYAIVDLQSGRALGVVCYARIDPPNGSIEIGGIVYSPPLKRTTSATESIFLLIQNVFDLGYRRCEWKCDSLNAPSRRAALRLGFSFEGLFRQAVVYKRRNRDTAWYSIIDRDWPELRPAYSKWLSAENFDAQGGQRTSLSELTRPLLKKVFLEEDTTLNRMQDA